MHCKFWAVKFLCQWAPTECLGFCFSFSELSNSVGAFKLWIFRVEIRTGSLIGNPTKLSPRCRHAHSFCILFGILLLTPAFSSTILFHKLLWNPRYFEKVDLPELFLSTFSFVMPFSHESEHTKVMTSLVINLSLAVFYLQSFPWEGLNKPRGDPDSSSSGHFTLCPPLPVSSAWFFCEASSSIFRVRLLPRQSLRTTCFWMFTLLAAWPVLHILAHSAHVLSPHPPDSFAKPPPRFSVLYSGHDNRSGSFVFECSPCNFAVGWRIAHRMKKWRCFVFVRVVSRLTDGGPHAKCSLFDTFLCIVRRLSSASPSAWNAPPSKECIPERFQGFLRVYYSDRIPCQGLQPLPDLFRIFWRCSNLCSSRAQTRLRVGQ